MDEQIQEEEMISSILMAACMLGSLSQLPEPVPAGIPTEVMLILEDEYEPLEDAYTDEELNLIYWVVQTEACYQSVESKSHVASVIFNMINHPTKRFGKTVKAIITKPKRFCIGRHKVISETTKEAVRMAYEENTAPGCYAFRSGKRRKRHAGFIYKFTDAAGHHFYGE